MCKSTTSSITPYKYNASHCNKQSVSCSTCSMPIKWLFLMWVWQYAGNEANGSLTTAGELQRIICCHVFLQKSLFSVKLSHEKKAGSPYIKVNNICFQLCLLYLCQFIRFCISVPTMFLLGKSKVWILGQISTVLNGNFCTFAQSVKANSGTTP